MTTIHRARSAAEMAAIVALDSALFPALDQETTRTDVVWWVACSVGEVLGYAGARLCVRENSVFLCRAGVRSDARGAGLQKRLIRARLRWAASIGAANAITYTIDNPASANSLIACGFRSYTPMWSWAGTAQYWYRKIGDE